MNNFPIRLKRLKCCLKEEEEEDEEKKKNPSSNHRDSISWTYVLSLLKALATSLNTVLSKKQWCMMGNQSGCPRNFPYTLCGSF